MPGEGSKMKTRHTLAKLLQLIQEGREAEFYSWGEWKSLRIHVLVDIDHSECQRCRELYHRFRPATIVHHVKHLKERPDLALSVYDPDTGERQLMSVCKGCHEELHPESLRQIVAQSEPVTEERWD